MQSDVTLVGGANPPAPLSTTQSAQRMTEQASVKPPAALAVSQALPRPADIGQTAAVAEAKIALSADDAPTAVSQGERVLKPYGVSMLPDAPAKGATAEKTEDAPRDEVV